MRAVWLLLLLGVAVVVGYLSVFTVDRTEYVYLTQFGRHVATYDGADESQAGLHFKWPWPIQSVQRLDRRLQFFDLPGAELMTRDPQRDTIDKTLTIDVYVCWRIVDADQFLRVVGTPDGARARLAERISSDLGAEIGQRPMDDLVSVEATGDNGAAARRVDRLREELRQRLLDGGDPSLRRMARERYGIEVVDLRLRRVNYPADVHETIFERIRSEREKKATDYQSEGDRLAADIRTTSNRRIEKLKARAEAEAIRVRGLADAYADRIRNEAQAQDPEFYAFLRELDALQRVLGDGKTLLLLSTRGELFDRLMHPPGPRGTPRRQESGVKGQESGER